MSTAADLTADLFDWLVGVAFGRFDIRLATGERQPPPEPGPFDPLPATSPGMLPDGETPFTPTPASWSMTPATRTTSRASSKRC